MTMGDSSEFLKKPDKNAGTSGGNKTVRLLLELFEPDESKYNEFNYEKLVHIEKVIWTIFPLLLLARLRGKKKKKEKEKRIHFSIHTVSLARLCCGRRDGGFELLGGFTRSLLARRTHSSWSGFIKFSFVH